jgi:hypothetical protein
MAEMNTPDYASPPTPSREQGIAPADHRAHAKWPAWKIAIAYGVLFWVAIGSIWMIDDHVLQASPAATTVPTTTVR